MADATTGAALDALRETAERARNADSPNWREVYPIADRTRLRTEFHRMCSPETILALLTEHTALREERDTLAEAAWTDSALVKFDATMQFGIGYDFEGMEHLRQEIHTAAGSYVVWPDRLGGAMRWSAYGGPDGALMMERFDSQDAAKAWVLTELVAARRAVPEVRR